MSFEEHVNKAIGIEGGYSDHKNDSGGKTNYGVTEHLARRYGYNGPMTALPLATAKNIYYKAFWVPLELDQVEKICPSIVYELFDTGINQGTGRAAEYLQISLNALNMQEKHFKDIAVDGDIGPATLSALKAYVHKRGAQGEMVLMRALNCLQGAFYINLSQRRKKDEDFTYGWLLNRVVI